MRHLTDDIDGVLGRGRLLICDRDRKWSNAVREFLEREGVRIVQTPFRAPHCNAYAERFVRSIKEECLNRIIPLGECHLRRTIADSVAHYNGGRCQVVRERLDNAGAVSVSDGVSFKPCLEVSLRAAL
jgi:putative transposase